MQIRCHLNKIMLNTHSIDATDRVCDTDQISIRGFATQVASVRSAASLGLTAGVKRKLATALGSPIGTSGVTSGAAPSQTGHAPLPLQSVVNGQTSNRDSQGVPARNSGGTLTSLSLESIS